MNKLIAPIPVKCLCQAAPAGQRLTGAILAYDGVIPAEALTPAQFTVEGHAITGVSVSERPDGSVPADAGCYVVLALEPTELIRMEGVGPQAKMLRDDPVLAVRQVAPIGDSCPPWASALTSVGEVEPLVERFTQKLFHSPRTGQDIPYNLFLPDCYGDGRDYPLVCFIHDMGAGSSETKMTLWQGIGATTWVEPEFQQEHPCIVVAPQYQRPLVGDGDPDRIETTFDLLESVIEDYNVDPNRVYGTGQSLGTISEIEMAVRRPDFFTALLLIAGQREHDQEGILALKDKKVFIVVSRGDPRAYSGMNASLELLAQAGAVIERADWDQDGGIVPEEQVEELKARNCNIRYAVLKTEERGFQCHMATWQVAYGIKGTKTWLLEQTRDD
ncbi:MAG: hypothetical protein LUD82_07510 [Clostridiales bacterium]|nr:hypothetical protein [Clostridiales bacterium]